MTAWLSIKANRTVLANTTGNLASAERGLKGAAVAMGGNFLALV